VITEETLKEYLTEDTIRLNLEHHYWIKDSFLDKMGRMAPNLRELCLRRMEISNYAFMQIMKEVHQLEKIDVSYCKNI